MKWNHSLISIILSLNFSIIFKIITSNIMKFIPTIKVLVPTNDNILARIKLLKNVPKLSTLNNSALNAANTNKSKANRRKQVTFILDTRPWLSKYFLVLLRSSVSRSKSTRKIWSNRLIRTVVVISSKANRLRWSNNWFIIIIHLLKNWSAKIIIIIHCFSFSSRTKKKKRSCSRNSRHNNHSREFRHYYYYYYCYYYYLLFICFLILFLFSYLVYFVFVLIFVLILFILFCFVLFLFWIFDS